MKRYRVKLVRRLDQSAVVAVDAENASDAAHAGIKMIPLFWRTDVTEDTYYESVKEIESPDPEPESEEKNITETFGADSSWEAELDISYDGDDLVSFCHISTKRNGQEYCSSIGVVESFGTVEGDNDGDVIKVPKYVFNEIHKWALEEGY